MTRKKMQAEPALKGLAAAFAFSYVFMSICLLINVWTAGHPGDWNMYPQSIYHAVWVLGPVRFCLVMAFSVAVGQAVYQEAYEKKALRDAQRSAEERRAVLKDGRKLDYAKLRGRTPEILKTCETEDAVPSARLTAVKAAAASLAVIAAAFATFDSLSRDSDTDRAER